MKTIIIMLSAAITLLMFGISTTTTAAQAQTSPDSVHVTNAPTDNATQKWVIDYVVSKILNMSEVSITINEDGSLSLSDWATKDVGYENEKMTTVYAPHPWTPEQGYKIDNGVLTAPNGTQLFP